jgi:hypothetical protein
MISSRMIFFRMKIQPNERLMNAIQNDINVNDIKMNDIKLNDIQMNDIQMNKSLQNDIK